MSTLSRPITAKKANGKHFLIGKDDQLDKVTAFVRTIECMFMNVKAYQLSEANISRVACEKVEAHFRGCFTFCRRRIDRDLLLTMSASAVGKR